MLRIRHSPDCPPQPYARRPGARWLRVRRPRLSHALAGLALCVAAGVSAQGTTSPSTPPTAPSAQPRLQAAPVDAPKFSGSIAGVVGDTAGTPISGAHIALSSANHTVLGETTSDDAGHFRFAQVGPGAFTVEVTLDGFNTLSAAGNLQLGQSVQLSPLLMALSTVNITVNAATASSAEVGLQDLHLEEKQRLLGVFPNFFVSYDWNAPPLTSRQKFTLATKNALDPGNLALVGTVAGVQQATNAFPAYSQGGKGYGRRYGADLGNLVVGTYLGGAILPVLFHQDPRYFYKGTGTVRSRFWYAVSTAFIARGDNGHRQPAFASILGDLSAGAVSNLYYDADDRQGAGLTFRNGILAIGGDAMNNVFQEFFLRKLTKEDKKAHQ